MVPQALCSVKLRNSGWIILFYLLIRTILFIFCVLDDRHRKWMGCPRVIEAPLAKWSDNDVESCSLVVFRPRLIRVWTPLSHVWSNDCLNRFTEEIFWEIWASHRLRAYEGQSNRQIERLWFRHLCRPERLGGSNANHSHHRRKRSKNTWRSSVADVLNFAIGWL